ncbi:Ribonuclease 3-like protein 3 [Cardamine amara subsp. amara]|uniref:Ribonuclease 3-like protein 3 n=1 Tax=Cardamine amara subsp. amara TaxID=228776 RepID=A0ABD0ZAC7_CARAN
MHIETIVDEDNLDVETEDKKEISSTEKLQLQTGSSSLHTASEIAQEDMVIDEDSPHVESEDAKGKSCEIFSTRKLQIETGSSSLSPNALTYEMTTKQMVVDEDSLEAGPEAKTKLFIICNKNKWPNPIFSVEEEKGPEKKQKYVCSVKIEIPSVEGTFHMKGDVKLRKKDAEYSAAYHMIRALNSSLMSLVISNLKMQKSLDEEKRKQNSLDEKKNLHSKKRKRKSLVENMNLQMLDKLEEKKNLQMQEILDENKNLQTRKISDEKKNMQTQESLEKKKNLQTQESSEEKKNLQMQESSDEKILNSVADSVEAETYSVEAVEKILNYSFTNNTLLKDAITQGSSS